MRTVTKTALANVRLNRGRNILSGVAIALTTLLIFVVVTVGYGLISVQSAAVNEYYPTWHYMFRGVSQENADALKLHDDIESIGLREDFGQIASDEAQILMIAMDDKAIELNKMELESGSFPKEKNDLVVSQGLLDVMDIQAGIGDEITLPYQIYDQEGAGFAKDGVFRICGFLETVKENIDKQLYTSLASIPFMEEQVSESDREYRTVFRFADAESLTTDQMEERAKEIGKEFGVHENDVVGNSEYLMANYTDPAFLQGIAVILLVIVLAGILTIYSIYYVSMIPKVQEYGKLKAMGATRKQIRQIVFREGMLVTAAAIPIGLLLGTLISKMTLVKMSQIMDNGMEFTKLQRRMLENGEVQILYVWIYLLAIVTALLTVCVSLMKPMQKAAKISPVEAMRYSGEKPSKKKERKGYQNLNLSKLTRANLARNKKRTAITTFTLGAMGILFMVIATILSCANPKQIARDAVEKDYRITIESWSGDKMHPEREWSSIQQNNPMDEAFLEQVKQVDGVEQIETKIFMDGELPDLVMDGEVWGADLGGFSEVYKKQLENGQIEGHITYEELMKGNKVIMSNSMLHWFPELKVGDSIHMVLVNGTEKVEKTFEIGAIGDYNQGFSNFSFLTADSVIKEMNDHNLNWRCEIAVQEEKKDTAYKELQALADETGFMETVNYEKELETWNSSMALLSMGSYAFLIILGGIGIMNLINTMINSIYTRKRELGMMQAVGLSEKQLIRMLQLEGGFYTLGTLLISVGIGSVAGYFVYLAAKADGMFNIKAYHFPVTAALILIVVVAVLQILLTYVISRNFRKMSLIDRVRYSE